MSRRTDGLFWAFVIAAVLAIIAIVVWVNYPHRGVTPTQSYVLPRTQSEASIAYTQLKKIEQLLESLRRGKMCVMDQEQAEQKYFEEELKRAYEEGRRPKLKKEWYNEHSISVLKPGEAKVQEQLIVARDWLLNNPGRRLPKELETIKFYPDSDTIYVGSESAPAGAYKAAVPVNQGNGSPKRTE